MLILFKAYNIYARIITKEYNKIRVKRNLLNQGLHDP